MTIAGNLWKKEGTPHLDRRHTVFGRVDGWNFFISIDTIRSQETGTGRSKEDGMRSIVEEKPESG